MIKLIEGEEFRFDLKKYSIETVTEVEIDGFYYSRTHTERPDWIRIEGFEVCGTVPLKKDQKHATLAVICKNTWDRSQFKLFHIEIVTQEEYDRDRIAIHIARCKEPLEEFEEEYPEAFQEWVGEYVFS